MHSNHWSSAQVLTVKCLQCVNTKTFIVGDLCLLTWKSILQLSRLLRYMYILIPGLYTIHWLNIQDNVAIISADNSSIDEKIVFTWMPYHFEYHSNLEQKIKWHIYKINISWNEASKICQDEGGYLPYFTNKQQLHELITLFKLSNETLTMKIFIGLNYYPTKVSSAFSNYNFPQSSQYISLNIFRNKCFNPAFMIFCSMCII